MTLESMRMEHRPAGQAFLVRFQDGWTFPLDLLYGFNRSNP
jgi:hypothetical protein